MARLGEGGDGEEKNGTDDSRELWSMWKRAASDKELDWVNEGVRGVH